MDERSLIPADPAAVMRQMAEAYLSAPVIAVQQGTIRLASHQVDAASRLLRLLGVYGGGILADTTGLGKTFVAIAVARVLGPTLVIAPAALRGMWRDALRRTGVEAEFESYEALSRGELPDRGALLVLDEAHHARNPSSRRYEALADLAWGAKVLLLTATPIHNRRRDLRALLALFIGSRAETLPDEEVHRLIVRRNAGSWSGSTELPAIRTPQWLEVPGDSVTLRAIKALPPAVPASDGETAHALLLLGLIRAWASSGAALSATLKRRLQRAAALAASLEAGRLPDKRELGSWPVVDDAIQLGFPELISANQGAVDIVRLRDTLDAHVDGVRAILLTVDAAHDDSRMKLLQSVRDTHRSTPIVAFTQFADTASAAFDKCAGSGGVALVTGRGARVSSGRVTVDEIVRGFDVQESPRSNAMPLDLLIATDVLSEGLSLRRAGVLVHLDLPWTIARLEQRVGRLRRPGSAHRSVAIYAIGPPVQTKELSTIVRALQRKARLSSAVTGVDELQGTIPLLKQRLTKATAMIAKRGDAHAVEDLRRCLASWLELGAKRNAQSAKGCAPAVPMGQPTVMALVAFGEEYRLLAVSDGVAAETPSDLLRVVRAISECGITHEGTPSINELSAIQKWLDEQRSRAIAQLAADNPSSAHVGVLRALQNLVGTSTRSERITLVRQVERCRQLVLSARGIGAELALARLLHEGTIIDLDHLQQLLESRLPVHVAGLTEARLVSVLRSAAQHGVTGFTVVDSPHPDRLRSSIHRAAHDAVRG